MHSAEVEESHLPWQKVCGTLDIVVVIYRAIYAAGFQNLSPSEAGGVATGRATNNSVQRLSADCLTYILANNNENCVRMDMPGMNKQIEYLVILHGNWSVIPLPNCYLLVFSYQYPL